MKRGSPRHGYIYRGMPSKGKDNNVKPTGIATGSSPRRQGAKCLGNQSSVQNGNQSNKQNDQLETNPAVVSQLQSKRSLDVQCAFGTGGLLM
ncbi:unnamed protein product [Calypogeia fissa]